MINDTFAGKAVTILLVEDNIAHAELIMRSFAEHRIANRIMHVCDGEAALAYLSRQVPYTNPHTSPRPHMILLDLHLPRVDGLEVLRQVKNTETLRSIPVVVLTTSEAERDITAAYARYANSYLVKPLNFAKFTQLMNDFGFYWLAWNRCPAP
jgi:CheY-like chemotaxis protein